MDKFELLLREIRACTMCAPHLPLGPRPVVQIHSQSRILITWLRRNPWFIEFVEELLPALRERVAEVMS